MEFILHTRHSEGSEIRRSAVIEQFDEGVIRSRNNTGTERRQPVAPTRQHPFSQCGLSLDRACAKLLRRLRDNEQTLPAQSRHGHVGEAQDERLSGPASRENFSRGSGRTSIADMGASRIVGGVPTLQQ